MKKKKWNKKRIIWIIVAVLAVFFVLRSCGGNSSNSMMSSAEVTRKDITSYNSFVGTVNSETDYSVYPKASGTVTAVYAEAGDTVVAGQVLATLDDEMVRYNIQLQQAQLDQSNTIAGLNIQDAKDSYESYKTNLDDGLNQSLMQAQSAKDQTWNAWKKAEEALADAKSMQKSSQSSVTEAEEEVKNAQAAVDAEKTNIDAYNVKKNEVARLEEEMNKAQEEYDLAVAGQSANVDGYKTSLQRATDAYMSEKSVLDGYANGNNYEQLQQNLVAAQAKLQAAQSAAGSVDLSALEEAVKTTGDAWNNANASYEAVSRQVQDQLKSLEGSVDKLEANSNQTTALLQLQHLRDSLDDYVIKAPVSGTLTSLNLKENETVSSGMPAAVISDLGSMKVSVKVDEYSILPVKEGSPVTVYIDSIKKSFAGVIQSVSSTATVAGGVSYFTADISFTPDEDVRNGMSVEVRLTTTDEKQVLSLPSKAISYHDDNSAYVLVANGKSMEERSIEIGASDGEFTQIVEGLEEGDTVYYSSNPYAEMMVGPGARSAE